MKDHWIDAYERRVEELAEEYKIEWEQAEKIMEMMLDENPGMIDEYMIGGC